MVSSRSLVGMNAHQVGCNLGRVVVYGGQELIINAEKECFLLLNNTEQRSVVVMTFLLGTR